MGWYVIIQCSYEKQFSCVCIDFFSKIDANFLSHKKTCKKIVHTKILQFSCEYHASIFAWYSHEKHFVSILHDFYKKVTRMEIIPATFSLFTPCEHYNKLKNSSYTCYNVFLRNRPDIHPYTPHLHGHIDPSVNNARYNVWCSPIQIAQPDTLSKG